MVCVLNYVRLFPYSMLRMQVKVVFDFFLNRVQLTVFHAASDYFRTIVNLMEILFRIETDDVFYPLSLVRVHLEAFKHKPVIFISPIHRLKDCFNLRLNWS